MTSILDHFAIVESCFSEKRLLMKTNAMDCTKYAETVNLFPLSTNVQLIEDDIPPVDFQDTNTSNIETLWLSGYGNRKKLWKLKTCLTFNTNSCSNTPEHILTSSPTFIQTNTSASSQYQLSSFSTASTIASSICEPSPSIPFID